VMWLVNVALSRLLRAIEGDEGVLASSPDL